MFAFRCSILTCMIFLTGSAKVNTCPELCCTCQMMYCATPRVYKNEHSICVCPLCILENGGVSDCYTGFAKIKPCSILLLFFHLRHKRRFWIYSCGRQAFLLPSDLLYSRTSGILWVQPSWR